jgi:peptide/nickel transport system substrate-binding protein
MLAAIGNSLESLIVPREILEMGPDVFTHAAVGAGPFMLDSMEEGYGYSLRRNPRFYERGIPRLQILERLLFQDLGSHEDALRTRAIDYWLSADATIATSLESEIEGIARIEHGSLEFNSFWMRTDAAPWNDARVRRAVNRALNRQQYIEIVGGGAGVPMGALAPAFGEYALPADELAALQPHDPAEALSLFAAAGVAELPFVYPLGGDTEVYVDLLTNQLATAGVLALPEALDPAAWLSGYVSSTHTASLSINQSYKTPDAALLWHRSGGPTGSGQYETGLSSRDLDQLIDAAATTLDEPERIEIYHEAQRAILDSDPAVLNFFNLTQHALHYDDTHGLDPGPGHMGEFLYRQVWVEEPKAT